MDWILRKPQTRRQYSVKRLNDLYSDLLDHVVLDQTMLGRRAPINQAMAAEERAHIFLKTLQEPSLKKKAKRRDLSTAFRVLSATPAADKEGMDGGSLAVRDKAAVLSMASARSMEDDLVKLIQKIGEVVAFGDEPGSSLRCDPVFEYFCEKQIMALFVDIAKAKPDTSDLHGVTWSPLVKSQVMNTISIMISNAQDGPSLYYLLSNNYVNDLIRSMMPLCQWTDFALQTMLPVFVALLKSVSLQLAAAPDTLIQFLTEGDEFPLFTSVTKVATSSLSDSFVRLTCTTIIVIIMTIPNHRVRNWIIAAEMEQKLLSLHICDRFLEKYGRIVNLTSGPVVDPVRASGIANQLADLQRQISELNDILWCGVRSMNVRLCESLLQRVFSVLLDRMMAKPERQFMVVGVMDLDVIPDVEARAQTAIVFFYQFFMALGYPPLIRMLAVTLFHPMSSTMWQNPRMPTDEYILTPALNTIVHPKECDEAERITNPYRKALLSYLSGKMGEWMFVPTSLLLESVMLSATIDLGTLISLDLVPNIGSGEDTEYFKSEVEEALSQFLRRKHENVSSLSIFSLERAGATSMTVLSQAANNIGGGGKNPQRIYQFLPLSPLVSSLRAVHAQFCQIALEAEQKVGISELFLDLAQLATTTRYSKLSDEYQSKIGCLLETFSCREHRLNSEVLVRTHRCVGSNDVEDCRFAIRMVLHFRALSKSIDALLEKVKHACKHKLAFPFFDPVDSADELLLTIGDIKDKPLPGADIDLRGRMVFRFHAASNRFERAMPKDREHSKQDLVLRPSSHLILVLDPADIYIVKPSTRRESNRGTIICSVSLQSIIAFASDAEWLHVAVRNTSDVGFLIRNGNLALHFESVGTCLIVQQFLERSQAGLRHDLKSKIYELCMAVPSTVASVGPTSTILPDRELGPTNGAIPEGMVTSSANYLAPNRERLLTA